MREEVIREEKRLYAKRNGYKMREDVIPEEVIREEKRLQEERKHDNNKRREAVIREEKR